MSELNNILVIRLSSLGDVMMTIPAVRAIRDLFPGAHLSWLVEGSVGEFLKDQTFIDEVIVFQRSSFSKAVKRGDAAGAVKAFLSCVSNLRQRRYDLVIDFHGIAKSVLLSRFVRAGKRIGFGKMFAKEKSHFFYDTNIHGTDQFVHKVERNMLMAHHLGHTGPIPMPELRTADEAMRYVDDFLGSFGGLKPVYAVNPFSSKGTDFKRWPIERYGELISRTYRELGKKAVIVWGPGEEKEARRLKEICGESAYLLCPTNISQLFALLDRTPVYLGGDTGVMHLAAAAGARVIALFGPTDFRINAPYGEENIVLREDVSCAPCKNRDCDNRVCMNQMTVDKVFDTVHTVLERSLQR